MKSQLTLRDLFWLVLVAGMGCAWWLDAWDVGSTTLDRMQVDAMGIYLLLRSLAIALPVICLAAFTGFAVGARQLGWSWFGLLLLCVIASACFSAMMIVHVLTSGIVT